MSCEEPLAKTKVRENDVGPKCGHQGSRPAQERAYRFGQFPGNTANPLLPLRPAEQPTTLARAATPGHGGGAPPARGRVSRESSRAGGCGRRADGVGRGGADAAAAARWRLRPARRLRPHCAAPDAAGVPEARPVSGGPGVGGGPVGLRQGGAFPAACARGARYSPASPALKLRSRKTAVRFWAPCSSSVPGCRYGMRSLASRQLRSIQASRAPVHLCMKREYLVILKSGLL